MFPCPHSGMFFTFDDVSAGISFGIDKRNITFIGLRLFINQGKDSFSSCQSHNDGVKLLGYLHKRLGKTLGKLQVGSHDTECDATHAGNGENTTENSSQHEL